MVGTVCPIDSAESSPDTERQPIQPPERSKPRLEMAGAASTARHGF
jgi:hypothetical protein